MKYKVGDVVKVRSDLSTDEKYDKLSVTADMLNYKGKVVHIEEVIENRYHIKENNKKWYWTDKMLEPLTEEDINKYFEEYAKSFKDYDIKVEIKKKEPIIDKEEKKYLSAVIRPFRDRVKYIVKSEYTDNTSRIAIYVARIDKRDSDIIYLPYFETNKMYKGMEDQKKYTLEELGI